MKSDAEWKKELTPQQYHVLREAGTDPPFQGPLLNEHREGVFVCAACGQPLYDSDAKFESGSGWPSFYQPIKPDAVVTETDSSHGMVRTEVLCSKCHGHLGHEFPDGPAPTGLRYCMNSTSLKFVEKDK
jgi:peptide-methionine (R)-S-oxide reductase